MQLAQVTGTWAANTLRLGGQHEHREEFTAQHAALGAESSQQVKGRL